MGWKTIKMEWDLCSSPPWVPFYPYTMFMNPIPRPSCQKSRKKTIITQNILVTQSSNIVHCNQHNQKPICADIQAFPNTFPCTNWWSFFIFCQREFRKTIITQKVLVTQSSNIENCNQHTQKPICADFQAFLNTLSLYKLMFFFFLSGRVKQTAKTFHFVASFLILTGQMH